MSGRGFATRWEKFLAHTGSVRPDAKLVEPAQPTVTARLLASGIILLAFGGGWRSGVDGHGQSRALPQAGNQTMVFSLLVY